MWYNIFIRKYPMTNNKRYFLLVAAVVIAVFGIFSVALKYYLIDMGIRDSLEERAKATAMLISGEDVSKLSGSIADLEDENYQKIKKKLYDMSMANSDVRFVYIMGLRGSRVFFYADSEPSDSVDYSPPGQLYTEASSQLLKIFIDGVPFTEGPIADRWGDWVSAFAPIYFIDQNGITKMAGVIGMDMDARLMRTQVYEGVLLVAFFVVVAELFLLFYYIYLTVIKIKKIEMIKKDQNQNK